MESLYKFMTNCIKCMLYPTNVLTPFCLNHKLCGLYLETSQKSPTPQNNSYNSIPPWPAVRIPSGQRHQSKTLHQFPWCHTTDCTQKWFSSTLAACILQKTENLFIMITQTQLRVNGIVQGCFCAVAKISFFSYEERKVQQGDC